MDTFDPQRMITCTQFVEKVPQPGGVPCVADAPFEHHFRKAQLLGIHMLGRLRMRKPNTIISSGYSAPSLFLARPTRPQI